MRESLRRGLPFFLTVALPAVGALDWYARTGCESCYGSGLPLTLGAFALALAAAGAFAALAVWLLSAAIDRALDARIGRVLFDPPTRTLAALVPVVGVALAAARPLFAGHLTAEPVVWAALALPYYPFALGLVAPFALLTEVGSVLAGGVPLFVALAVGLLAASALEVAWLYLLASGVGRAAHWVTSRRNSASE